MPITTNPAPCDDGNRALEKGFVGAKNLKERTRFRPENQCPHDLQSLLAAAPDDTQFPIICCHWPIISKQKMLPTSDAGRGGVA